MKATVTIMLSKRLKLFPVRPTESHCLMIVENVRESLLLKLISDNVMKKISSI